MKLLLATCAAALTLAVVVPEDAAAQQQGRSYRAKKVKKVERARTRAPSVGANGLCQRDTGTPTGNLNFRNRCDTEEFWNRINERAGIGIE